MIKVLIVVSGLVMFVPDTPNNTVTALLVGTKSMRGMVEHIPQLHLYPASSSSQSWNLEHQVNNSVLIRVKAKNRLSINLDAKKDYAQMSQLTTGAKVKPECLAGKCKQVAATVRFEGGWQTRPLQRCSDEWSFPVSFEKEIVKSGFRKPPAFDKPLKSQPPRRLATGLALEADIEKLEDLRLEIKGASQKLQLAKPGKCKRWRGTDEPCVIIEVENWAVPTPPLCGKNKPDPCRPDRHFAMFYDLLVNPPANGDRWLPYAVSPAADLKCPSSGDTKPAIRCPTTF